MSAEERSEMPKKDAAGRWMKTDQPPTSAMATANWFLSRSWRDPDKPKCDLMKLNKIVFYAHGWFMGNRHAELFHEDIEAWPHGPVVRDLYIEFNDAGRESITRLGKRIEKQGEEIVRVIPKHNESLDFFFEAIWKEYGDYTGIQLSNMTHRPGEAWTIIAEMFNYDLSAKPRIPSDIIESVFGKKVAERTG